MVPTDAELLTRMRGGEAEAANLLASRHREWAVATAHKLGAGADAEDLAHEAMLSLIQRPPENLQRESLRPLLQTVIWQRIENGRRKLGRNVRPLSGSGPVDGQRSPSSLVAARQERSQLFRVVEGLKTRERELFRLRYVEDLPAPEISVELGISPGAVRVALHRLKGLLRQVIRA